MAIKNFKAPTPKVVEKNSDVILVSDYMAKNVITFKKDQPILEVMHIFVKNNISGGPVVGEFNELLGMISEADCMKQISESRYYNMPLVNVLVEKYMDTNLDTISPNTTIFDAARKFYTTKRKRFPVVQDDKLVGQISRKDILRAAFQLKHYRW